MSPCCAIGIALAKVGHTEQARQMFAKAMAAATAPKQSSQAQAFSTNGNFARVAAAEVEAGFLDDALATVERIDIPYVLVETLCKIAQSYATLGQVDRAADAFRKAATHVAQIDDCQRWSMWVKIASRRPKRK